MPGIGLELSRALNNRPLRQWPPEGKAALSCLVAYNVAPSFPYLKIVYYDSKTAFLYKTGSKVVYHVTYK